MKKLCLTLFCLHLLCGVGFAEDYTFVFGLGSTSGQTTVKGFRGSLSEFSTEFDHQISGGSFKFGIQRILESGFLYGSGYQSLRATGDTSVIDGITEYNLQTTSFNLGVAYFAVGYNIEVTENLFFQPNVQLGLAFINSSYTLYEDSRISILLSGSGTGTSFGIILPLVYQLENNWNVGGELLLGGGGLTLIDITTGYEVTSVISSAAQLTFGYNFSL